MYLAFLVFLWLCGVAVTGASYYYPWSVNPVLVPSSGSSTQGWNNCYAPDLHQLGAAYQNSWVMFYGSQSGDGHDQIFLAFSEDKQQWRKHPSDHSPQPCLSRGTSNHVNDPSAVYARGKWWLYYTDAVVDIDDRVWLATATSLDTSFTKIAKVIDVGPAGSWSSYKVGRPSVRYINDTFWMWYDGQDSTIRSCIGLAFSSDGINFIQYSGNPVFCDVAAIDVKELHDPIDGHIVSYMMAIQGGDGSYWANSPDGISWAYQGLLVPVSGQDYDRYGQVTPFLELSADQSQVSAVWYGGASASSWDKNAIAVSFQTGGAPNVTTGGCTYCTTRGVSCAEQCATSKNGDTGYCGAPGSHDSSACCACYSDKCATCLPTGELDCFTACCDSGAAAGMCGDGLTPSDCCVCY
ncbi:Ubiquinone/menaquinone biosynthesis C-methyltransferase UbiE [Pelomyxa schiedti]|nr:Ubiquinone/menaquinone biosynthesis C-methyltransferase UbiE [Pelomyxa schiedti]